MISATTDSLIRGWQIGRLQPMPERVPRGWELVRLTDVATLESGHTPSRRFPEYWKGDIPWISLHDTDNLDGPEIYTTSQTIGELGLANSSARLLPKGTVVLSRTATVGKTTVMGRSMATSQDFANYVCGERVHNYFLMHLFRFLAPEWKRLKAGSTLNTIYMPVFRALQVLLPPIDEQRTIAAALSDVDALLGALDQVIAKKRDLRAAVMQQLLTGRIRLPGFSDKWKTRRIGDLADVDPEQLPSSTKPEYEFSYISLEDVDRGSLRSHTTQTFRFAPSRARRRLRFGDVLVSTVRPNLKSHLWFKETSVDWICSTGFAVIRCRDKAGYPGFIFAHLFADGIASQVDALLTGSNYPAINSRDVRRLEIATPAIEEQHAIVEALADIDAEIFVLEQRSDKTRLLKQGMMQELLTGRTRLV